MYTHTHTHIWIHILTHTYTQISQGDQRMEDNALMMQGPPLTDTKTSRLYENCRDSSLTVEDAELCERRAGAIRLLTRAAVASQIAQSPPVVPDDSSRDRQYMRDKADAYRQTLAAEALMGRDFRDDTHKSRFKLVRRALSAAKHKLSALQKTVPFTYMSNKARREQLVNTYNEYMPSGSQVVCTCDAKNAGDEENEGLNPNVKPACSCKGGSMTKFTNTEQGGVLDTGPKGAWPQGLPIQSKIDGYGADAYKARPQQLVSVSGHKGGVHAKNSKHAAVAHASSTHKHSAVHAKKPITHPSAHKVVPKAAAAVKHPVKNVKSATASKSTESDSQNKTPLSQLGVLKRAVEAASKDKDQAKVGDTSDKKLLALEDKISKTEQSLAARKREFRHELEKRQVTLITDFHNEMREIQDGIQLATGATAPIGQESSMEVLGEANSALTQDQQTQINDGAPEVSATRAADFGDVARVENAAIQKSVGMEEKGAPQSQVIVKEIMQRVKESQYVCVYMCVCVCM